MSRILLLCCLLAVSASGRPQAARAEELPSDDLKQAGELKILKALANGTSFEFVDTPLQDAIDYLKEYHGIEIQFDLKALEGPAITPAETTVNATLKGVSLRSGLKHLLGRVDDSLTFVIKDEVLLITTKTTAERMVETQIYDLLDCSHAELVKQVVAWHHRAQFTGAPEPSVTASGKLLIVSASLPEQNVVRGFLADLEEKSNSAKAAARDAHPAADGTDRATRNLTDQNGASSFSDADEPDEASNPFGGEPRRSRVVAPAKPPRPAAAQPAPMGDDPFGDR